MKKQIRPKKQKKTKSLFQPRQRSLSMPQKVHLLSYEITSEPLEDKKIPQEVKNRLEELYDLTNQKPMEAIPILSELKEKYPTVPVLYNYLSVAYSRCGDFQRLDEIALENYEKNPDYLFARLNYAQICMRKGELKKVPEILDNKFDLKLLYPHRTTFHVSEVVNFGGVVGLYFCAIGEPEKAKMYYKIIKELAPDHEITKNLGRSLSPSIVKQALDRLVKRLLK